MFKYILLTNDVETTSIVNNSLSDKTGELVLKEGMPILLELYNQYKIKSTFFFTGYIANKFPEVVKMVTPYGHEIGCHGYSHRVDDAFDILDFKTQVEHLEKSKKILEDISGCEVISFRAPAGRVNKHTPRALEKCGFRIDSSVSSQRFDMFLSFGGFKKLKWLFAPRKPYYISKDDLSKRGTGSIFEIPVSALIIPYIGTVLRISPFFTRLIRRILHIESKINQKPIVFLIHPNEFIEEELNKKSITRRGSNFISYLFCDILRRKLKLNNLGKKAVILYRKEIEYFKKKKYKFMRCKDYYELFSRNN
ncbi:MAG: polysaccharide deacetylase family protein [Promethearchaeota archaeon]